MSRTETVTITCDLQHLGESAPAAVTHTFSVDDHAIEVDLCVSCLSELKNCVAEFVEAGRKPAPRRPAQEHRTRADQNRAVAIRTWAVGQGLLADGSRGRIPLGVLAKYDAAHGGAR